LSWGLNEDRESVRYVLKSHTGLRRLTGGIAMALGWRPADISISWAADGPVVIHRMRRYVGEPRRE
jgi:hypothetical protein